MNIENENTVEEAEEMVVIPKNQGRKRALGFMGEGAMSLTDFNKIYDKTIQKGIEHQAFVPKIGEPNKPNFLFKVYGYSAKKVIIDTIDRTPTCTFVKNEEYTLRVNLPRRSTSDFLEWDPTHLCDDFKLLCFRLTQYIKQNYNMEFTDAEILEYYRICKMNKAIFLNTIHTDQSPFLEYVRVKRSRMLKQ